MFVTYDFYQFEIIIIMLEVDHIVEERKRQINILVNACRFKTFYVIEAQLLYTLCPPVRSCVCTKKGIRNFILLFKVLAATLLKASSGT